MTLPNTLSEILQELVASAVIFVVTLLYSRSRAAIERMHPSARSAGLMLILVAYYGINLWFLRDPGPHAWIPFLITTLLVGWLIIRELFSFWRIGLVGADQSASLGISYAKALGFCQDSLDFLGIGASKLTEERDAFMAAIVRCNRPERPIRFLLSAPTNETLQSAAKQAGRPEREYQDRVRVSLRVLKQYREEQARNIEVRFYSDPPLFRLMFIDDSLCIVSHYVLGEGDGSQLAQLHVRRSIWGRRNNESIYYPLKLYFDQLWERAKPWDFHEHIA